MKKFKNFGYKQETIEVREISMGNLVHIICQALIAKDKKDMEIRIVDCYAGQSEFTHLLPNRNFKGVANISKKGTRCRSPNRM